MFPPAFILAAVLIVVMITCVVTGDMSPNEFYFYRSFTGVITMSNLAKLEFIALDITGSNYIPWTVDIKNHLRAKGLLQTLDKENNSSDSDKATSLIFIRRHIDESLKIEHLTVDNPHELWESLKNRYDHQKDVILPKYRDEWNTLRFQDFKTVSEYNSKIHLIAAYLKYCGVEVTDAEMIEKTLSTFHATDVTIQQQYRIREYKEYPKLVIALLQAEKYNELLIKNHESRPTCSKAFSEVNFIKSDKPMNNSQGRGRGRGRGRGNGRGRGDYNNPPHHKRTRNEWDQGNSNKQERGSSSSSGHDSVCHKCGLKGHWYKSCRTHEHFVKLYKESEDRKGKGNEANFTIHPSNEFTQFESSDFFNDLGNIGGNCTDGKEVNYIDRDPIEEYTHLG